MGVKSLISNGGAIFTTISEEKEQGLPTRVKLYNELEKAFKKPIVSFFTSFKTSTGIDDADVDMMANMLQRLDLKDGFALLISSPGGDALAAERIIQVCRKFSRTGSYETIVPARAKSAATMICLGSSLIHMGPMSELGPIDPQIFFNDEGEENAISVSSEIKSYYRLLDKAENTKGNNEPYLMLLSGYSASKIAQYEAHTALAECIAIRALETGMMKDLPYEEIKKRIQVFLEPDSTKVKVHSRPIFHDSIISNDFIINEIDCTSRTWRIIYDLYARIHLGFMTNNSKLIESKNYSIYKKG